MVPLLSVHVAAASVKATARCPHWVACLAKKHRKAGTTRGTSVLVAVSRWREWVWPLTRFASRKWRSGLNRISHPDWVKFSVELNCAPKQNTRFSSSLQPFKPLSSQRIHVYIYTRTYIRTIHTYIRIIIVLDTRVRNNIWTFYNFLFVFS